MAKYLTGFIGAGNMGGALACAAAKGEAKGRMLIADKDNKKADALSKTLCCETADSLRTAAECEFIFLGVKPQFLKGLLDEISPVLKNRTDRFVLVSMAAGVSTKSIFDMLESEYHVLRIMPNTPCRLGEGMILYSPAGGATEADVERFLSFMAAAGKFDRLPESLIDAGCAISGCGPAFAYMFIDALADAGVASGLTKKQAVMYAAQTLLGSAAMALEGEKSPADLKDDVCSPGGSTIAGVAELEKNGFRNAVIAAAGSALKRTKELGEK